MSEVALVYSPLTASHDTGYFVTEFAQDVWFHHLKNIEAAFRDDIFKPSEVLFPFPPIFDHPENAFRQEIVLKTLDNWGLLSQFEAVESSPAIISDLLKVHSAEYISWLADFCAKNPGNFAGDATPVSTQSFEAALQSAGAALTAGKLVLEGSAKRAFAFCRPPGHHSGKANASGFCLFNNVAVLASYALSQPNIQRVMIVDWDVHHGNGTQEIFWDNPQVLFNSYHQFGQGVYPRSGATDEIGEGAGRGYSVNVPMPLHCTDELYQKVFNQITSALVAQFQPNLILVSAGQDGHFSDLLHPYLWEEGAGLALTAQHYHSLTRHILELAENCCEGRCVFVQEGGYNPVNLSNSNLNIAAALLNLPPLVQEQPLIQPNTSLSTADTIIKAVQTPHNFWRF